MDLSGRQQVSSTTTPLLASTADVTGLGAGTAQKPKTPSEKRRSIPPESESSSRKFAMRVRSPTPWEDHDGGWPITGREPPEPEIWRLDRVARVTGLSRTAIYDLMGDGKFPRPLQLTENGRLIGWVSTEIVRYVRSRIAARDKEAAA
jgi:prophage regulatory protein